MRRMTKLAAAMLVVTFAMSMAPKKADASIISTLIDLTYFDYSQPTALMISNYTGRDVRFRVWTSDGRYEKRKVSADRNYGLAVWDDAPRYAIEAAVWNKSKQKYIVKDYIEVSWGATVVFDKIGQGDFRLGAWYLR